ncbi:hypothetical protein [Paenibacillus sp. JMULE4]|uniref:hypothetical protein n=1 Tax=Paenibacillus TaxID=44249 RepID=UPI0020C6C21D|nr:hypothetical protein [Paenibacillus sp. JMULE4]
MLRIVLFYVPLGTSLLLAALTHVIVNGVLARSEQPDVTISSYAVALSLSFLIDLPMTIIRQVSSKYARDRTSFRAVARLTAVTSGILVLLSLIIACTPAGQLLFRYVFGVKEHLIHPTVQVYQVLALLYLFTAFRCLYQGVIINQLRTGWMTVGMAVRVAVMFGMSWYFIRNGWTDDGRYGAVIFMVGVIIECMVSVWEGSALKKRLPERGDHQSIELARHLLPFYLPLLYSLMVLVLLNPSIQAALNARFSPDDLIGCRGKMAVGRCSWRARAVAAGNSDAVEIIVHTEFAVSLDRFFSREMHAAGENQTDYGEQNGICAVLRRFIDFVRFYDSSSERRTGRSGCRHRGAIGAGNGICPASPAGKTVRPVPAEPLNRLRLIAALSYGQDIKRL